MTRALLKDSVLTTIENRKLRPRLDSSKIRENENEVAALIFPLNGSAAFRIRILMTASEDECQSQLRPTNSQEERKLKPLQYEISVCCLREGEVLATNSTITHITEPTIYYPPLELQYMWASNENRLSLGFLELDFLHSYEGMEMSIRDPNETIMQKALRSFKIQARPLRWKSSPSGLMGRDSDTSSTRYAIFEDEEIAFGRRSGSSSELEKSPFLVNGAGTSQDHLHIFLFSKVVDKKPGKKRSHEARQFEIFLSVFDVVQGRISWFIHTTTGGDISEGKADMPVVAWALHPRLPLLVGNIPGHHLRISNIVSNEPPLNIAGKKPTSHGNLAKLISRAEPLTIEGNPTQAIRFSQNGRYIAIQARQAFKNGFINFRTSQNLWSIVLCDLVESKTIEATLANESNLSIDLRNEIVYTYRLTRGGAIESTLYSLPDLGLAQRMYLTFIPVGCCCQTCGKPFYPQCDISIIEQQGLKHVILGHNTPLNIGRVSMETQACEPLMLRITSPPVELQNLGSKSNIGDQDGSFIITSSNSFPEILNAEKELLENAFADSQRYCEKKGTTCSCRICSAEALPNSTLLEARGIKQMRHLVSDSKLVELATGESLEPEQVEWFIQKLEMNTIKKLALEKSSEHDTRRSLMRLKKIYGDDYFPWDSWVDFREAMEDTRNEFDFNAYIEKLFEPGNCGIGCQIPLFINTFSFNNGKDSAELDFHWSSALTGGWIEEDVKLFYDRLFGGDFEGARKWYPFPAYFTLSARLEKLQSDQTPKGVRYRKLWGEGDDSNERETLMEISLPERESSGDMALEGPKDGIAQGGLLFPLRLKEVFESISDVVPGFGNFFEQRLRTVLNQSLVGDMAEEGLI
jgi:hypothetical protein